MNAKTYMLICVFAMLAGVGCDESYRMEFSIPLAGKTAALQSPPPMIVDPLDVQIAVEKMVGDAGLKPEVKSVTEDDLFSNIDEGIESSSLNVRSWRHPAYPLSLSMEHHENEFVLLLDYAPEDKADPIAVKLYSQLEKQLSALPVELTTPQSSN